MNNFKTNKTNKEKNKKQANHFILVLVTKQKKNHRRMLPLFGPGYFKMS